MGDRTAFFYGTLMAPPVLHRVIYGTTTPEPWQKALTTVRPALLQGYTRHKVKNLDYPGILPTSTSTNTSSTSLPPSVRGTLVTGLTPGDIWRLDIFEGDQYARRNVRVKILKESTTSLTASVDENDLESHVEGEVDAETYVWVAPREELEGEEWDFEVFKREKMWAWVGEESGETQVDEGFGDVDRAVEGARDGTGGRGVNGGITRELERAAA